MADSRCWLLEFQFTKSLLTSIRHPPTPESLLGTCLASWVLTALARPWNARTGASRPPSWPEVTSGGVRTSS